MLPRTAQPQSSAPSDPVRVRFDRFQLDEANASLLRDDTPVALAPTPFAVLCALVRKPGSLLTKNALLDEVWGHQFVSESVLKTVISELRTILGDDARHPRFIETVSRRGYRFIAPTTGISAGSPAWRKRIRSGALHVPSFVGRTEALSRLRRAWKAACSGKRTVVWVAGEAGIGKTTLIERFIADLGEVACARGQCVEQYGTGEPYLPVLDALAELCRSDSSVAALLRAVAPAWLVQLPWLSTAEERDALRRELEGVRPDRMLREMGEFFDRYTEHRPLLLVTEDLHWSDHATIQLINHVARRRGSAHLMWIGSFRLAEIVAGDHPLKALRNELRLHGLCEEVVLDEFSEQEVAAYVAQRAPSVAGDEAFVRALHERTDGLPLFVAYVMNEIAARTAQGGADAPASLLLGNMAMPENLAAVIDRYIDRLGLEQHALLSAAAVCGVEFRARTVAYSLDRDAAAVDEKCGQLAHEQLWLVAPRSEGGSDATDLPYSFRHALVRQLLYERIGPLARAELHLKVGRALERERAAGVPVSAAELAMHFERGHEPMTALRYYAEAAQAALLHLSPAECMTLSERGLSLLDQAPAGIERHALEITLATLKGASADHLFGVASSEAKSAFQRAYSRLAEVPQHPMRGLVLHGLGFLLCMRAEYDEARALAERAEALAAATNDPVLMPCVCTVQAEVHTLQGRPRAARAWAERGLAAIAAPDAPLECSSFDRSAGHAPGVARHATARISVSSRPLAFTCGSRAIARAGWGDRWRRWSQYGTTPCSRCDSAMPEASQHSPTRCMRSSRSSRSCRVEPRVAGFGVGRTPEWENRATGIAASGTPTKRMRGSECLRERARRGHMPWRPSCSPATGMPPNMNSRRCSGSQTRSGSACICRSSSCWRLPSRGDVASPLSRATRFGARWKRRERARRRGSS